MRAADMSDAGDMTQTVAEAQAVPTIRASGVASVRDYGVAHLYQTFAQARLVFVIWGIAFLVGMHIVLAILIPDWLEDPGWVVPLTFLGILGIDYFLFAHGFVQGWKFNRDSNVELLVWRFCADHLEFYHPLTEVKWKWDALASAKLMRQRVLLCIDSNTYFLFVRPMFDSDADWRAFRLLVKRQKCKCHRCDYLLKGSQSDTCPECGTPIDPP
jgi:hypothetical protein